MIGYLFGISALQTYNIPDVWSKIVPMKKVFLNGKAKKEIIFFKEGSIYVPSEYRKNVIVHTSKIKGAEKYVTSDGRCSIPLAYMQVANDFNFIEYVYLGMQIVSGYGGRSPICSIAELYECAASLEGYPGRSTALKAISFLCEGSRSPMESLLYMMLRLPVHYGGRGFKKIKLNHKIRLEEYNCTFYADLIWEEKNLIIEYMGEWHSETAEQREADERRKVLLESAGFTVLWVWKIDVFDKTNFELLVNLISSCTRHYVRYRSGKFVIGFTQIRKILTKPGTEILDLTKQIPRKALALTKKMKMAYSYYLGYFNRVISKYFIVFSRDFLRRRGAVW